MINWKFILQKILELSSGVAIGFLIYHFSNPSTLAEHLLSISISLITAMIVSSIFDFSRVFEAQKKYDLYIKNLLDISKSHGLLSPVMRLFINNGIAYLSAERFPLIYLDILWNINSTYDTTMIININDVDAGHNKQALEIQRAKIFASGVNIRRVFICENEDVKNKLMNYMGEQAQCGIAVFYILKDDIQKDFVLRKAKSSIDSLDFSIIDNNYTLTTLINSRNQKIDKFRISSDSEEVKKYNEIYSSIISNSKRL